MCGIAGFLDPRIENASAQAKLTRMLDRIAYRGPDDSGVWIDGPVAIGHRRLSIVDLSPLGHQPMVSASGRYVIAFNGEIYNHQRLRQPLEAQGIRFKGHSDTETLLALIEQYGLDAALRQCIGMFAVVLWDRRDRQLQLARDRFGEKPLYYGWHGGKFLFGSELKALVGHSTFERTVDPDSVAQLIRFGYVPTPHSIYRNTFKLEPGTILTLKFPDPSEPLSQSASNTSKQKYWSHEAVLLQGMKKPYKGTYSEAIVELDALMSDAVGLQMQADVPLGALLSGGVDSSMVVALMQRLSTRPIRTYSIGFDIAAFNEAEHAKAVARHLGTEHTELYVSSADALAVIPEIPLMYDEPHGDSSQIPTYLVAQLARSDVTVALSGDGGDEIFCGYHKYAFGQRYAHLTGRKTIGHLIGALPWNGLEYVASYLPDPIRRRVTAARFKTLHQLLTTTRPQQIAEIASVLCRNEGDLVPSSTRRASAFTLRRPAVLEAAYQPLTMLLDRETYLPDDVLTKVDRATMAVSLESRAPLLDHRIAEFASRLPMDFFVNGTVTKRILRDTLYRQVPQSLVDRPKAGFSVPVANWLRNDLHGWAQDLLQTRKSTEVLDLDRCRALFNEHCVGGKDHSAVIWTVLGFLAWEEQWL